MRSDSLPGVEVTLRVDGDDLIEYEDDEAGENENTDHVPNSSPTAVCYVEASSGARFSVQVTFGPDFQFLADAIMLRISLDGACIPYPQLHVFLEDLQFHTMSISGVKEDVEGEWQERKFTFAALQTNDDDVADFHLKQKLAHLGEVTLALYRCRVVRRSQNLPRAHPFRAPVDSSIPEKATKGRAISNYIKLDEPVPAQLGQFVEAEYPWGTRPLLNFTFKYRARTDLQIKGILPQELPLEERDPNTLTLEEARELIQLQNERLQNPVHVKREKRARSTLEEDEESDHEDIEILGEELVRKRPRAVPAAGAEVIDLSED